MISGCIGHTYSVGAGTPAAAGMSFMPHLGHLPSQVATISACIGQAKTPVSPSGSPMSISATKESVLSGSVSR